MKKVLKLSPYVLSTLFVALKSYGEHISANIIMSDGNPEIEEIYIKQKKELVELMNYIKDSEVYDYEM